MSKISSIKKYFVILTGLIQINFSNQVGVRPEFNYCYPGTKCWQRVLERKYHEWGGLCIHGSYQSPIDLPAVEPRSASRTVPLQFNRNSHRVTDYYIKNNGHTIVVKPVNNVSRDYYERQGEPKEEINVLGLTKNIVDSVASLASLALGSTSDDELTRRKNNHNYIFAQTHFHWGPNNSVGSEHTVNGKHYAMEMHMVHFSSKYESMAEAGKAHSDPSALSVIGIFFDAADDHPDNPLLEQIITHMPMEHHEEGKPDPLIRFNIRSFLPESGATFYRYYGSLTTPNCDEIVLWNVFSKPIKISTHDMDKFRLVKDQHGDLTERNYRNVQIGNLRPIFFLKLE